MSEHGENVESKRGYRAWGPEETINYSLRALDASAESYNHGQASIILPFTSQVMFLSLQNTQWSCLNNELHPHWKLSSRRLHRQSHYPASITAIHLFTSKSRQKGCIDLGLVFIIIDPFQPNKLCSLPPSSSKNLYAEIDASSQSAHINSRLNL